MTIALRYSILPYPNGCFLSASFPASFVPTMVITELAASERLLTASITIAMELAVSPMIALKATRNKLARIPTMLVRMMVLSLVVCSFILAPPALRPRLHELPSYPLWAQSAQ